MKRIILVSFLSFFSALCIEASLPSSSQLPSNSSLRAARAQLTKVLAKPVTTGISTDAGDAKKAAEASQQSPLPLSNNELKNIGVHIPLNAARVYNLADTVTALDLIGKIAVGSTHATGGKAEVNHKKFADFTAVGYALNSAEHTRGDAVLVHRDKKYYYGVVVAAIKNTTNYYVQFENAQIAAIDRLHIAARPK